ncbi:MAG: hypothetical protein Kow0062_28150 [Acidobacteriota bacterium]|nr:MAG: FHA domain-containing protein [Acidobacteriota bacterium]
MRDGLTRNLRGSASGLSFSEFRQAFESSLVVLSGAAAGTRLALRQPRTVIGRGQDADVRIADASLSRQHAVVEYVPAGGFRVRDLGSTNGVTVDGRRVDAVDLEPGDRFALGEVEFQLLVEEREDEPEVYELTLDS